MGVYRAGKFFDQTMTNPYENNIAYTDKWAMFKLLEIADFNLFTGGGPKELFRLIVTKENAADWPFYLHDFIQYEPMCDKNIILAVDKEYLESARLVYGSHNGAGT